MASVLGIGVATCDVVNTVDVYPPEDTKVRIRSRRTARGGNVTNTLVVLGQLGHRCAWGGTVAGDEQGRWILSELHRAGVDTRGCRLYPEASTPTSYILYSLATGSRTIAHYRDLPEFHAADFRRLPVGGHDWVHFEGRHVKDTAAMLACMAEEHGDVTRSVEIERPRPHIERLFDHAHVLFFSKDYMMAAGAEDGPAAFLEGMHRRLPHARLLGTWGDGGAYGIGPEGRVLHSPAYPPDEIVETIGAGDTFNAGVIDALVSGRRLGEALESGCRLAGAKCGRAGFELAPRAHAAGGP